MFTPPPICSFANPFAHLVAHLPTLLPACLPKMTIWCDVEILEHIVYKEILKYAQIGLQILKVQTLKYRSTMEKFLESILCPRNKQSKGAQVIYLSHTPRILLRALKYYATRPLPEGPKGGASRHIAMGCVGRTLRGGWLRGAGHRP